MRRQIVRISSEKLAQIIYMELIDAGIHNAEEVYEVLSDRHGSITISVSDDVNVFEEDD